MVRGGERMCGGGDEEGRGEGGDCMTEESSSVQCKCSYLWRHC